MIERVDCQKKMIDVIYGSLLPVKRYSSVNQNSSHIGLRNYKNVENVHIAFNLLLEIPIRSNTLIPIRFDIFEQ
jgi:hypothetical protein